MVIKINGKECAKEIKNKAKEICNNLKKNSIIPRLDIISVGNDPASKIYIKNKTKACEEVGIDLHLHKFDEDIDRIKLTRIIKNLNKSINVHGIMVQEPLPKHLEGISECIDPSKDVDGFTSMNIGKIFLNDGNFFEPCTPSGIIKLIKSTEISIEGKHAVIIGRSKIVGKPLAGLLLNENATVTICHSKTENLKEICKSSDILISAVGKPKFITREFIGNNTKVVIDVGINRLENGKVVGDVDFDDVTEYFEKEHNYTNNYITPVPGGVGPMTVAMLMNNTVISASNLK